MTAKVTLVGAGPGGKGLLTLAGAQALSEADAVVYDRLVSEDILDLIRPDAERISVGKENNHHPVPQRRINEILVECAQKGWNTVRLKGGDCYLFGRGGEECEYLLEHDVPFAVLPGVTSALAAPAYAGIPVTHRDFCSSVHIITAHARAGKTPDIDFASLARLGGTLVFLMGLTALPQVMDGLLKAGMAPDTPAALIENGTRGSQRKVIAKVQTLYERTQKEQMHSPALIVVGKVCCLSGRLDWFSALPLHGKTIAVTRPQARAGTLAERLRALGAEVIECPCIETMPMEDYAALETALQEKWDWCVFTSPAGVSAVVDALRALGRDLRALYGMRFAVIGAGTAKALETYGLTADLQPAQFDGAHLGQALTETVRPDERVLLLRAETGAPALPDALTQTGIPFADVPLYRTIYRSEKAETMRKLLTEQTLDVVTFTSVSTVEGFVQAVGAERLDGFIALCIGQQTAEAAQKHGMRVQIAKNATIDDMIARLLEE